MDISHATSEQLLRDASFVKIAIWLGWVPPPRLRQDCNNTNWLIPFFESVMYEISRCRAPFSKTFDNFRDSIKEILFANALLARTNSKHSCLSADTVKAKANVRCLVVHGKYE